MGSTGARSADTEIGTGRTRLKKTMTKKEIKILERVFTRLITGPINLGVLEGTKVTVKVTRKEA